jgi:hypothetical protein
VKHVKEIARLMKLREYEPEVALAVRIRGTEPFPGMETKETIDTYDEGYQNETGNGDIDGLLMSCGFEYVDATRPLETASAEGASGDFSENGMEDGTFGHFDFSFDDKYNE